MPRPKGSKNKNIEKIKCNKCEELRNPSQFYKSNSPLFNGYAPICKICVKNYVDENDMETVYSMLQQLDIVFDPYYWEQAKESDRDTFGKYVSMANTLHQLKGKRWKDSKFIKKDNVIEVDENDLVIINPENEFQLTDDIIQFWGSGYTKEQYRKLNNFKEDMLLSYDIETASHRDYLKKICIVSLKMDEALSNNDIDTFKKLSDTYDKLMHSAKFTAVQRSAADRTGGMNTFSEFFEYIEKEGFIPKFHTDEPQDIVDETINNLMRYTKNLILGDPNIGGLVESALQKLNEKEDEIDDVAIDNIEDEEDVYYEG